MIDPDVLSARGVRVLDPRQTFVDDDVDPARVLAGAALYPGTRLHGRRTFIGPRAEVGSEGPATLIDTVLADGAGVASGYAKGVVLMRAAKLGANAHAREGTILEEEASTAHAVGLKQTILLSHVTLGSLINFCDVLMAGGTSRADHSEVGSGFIHFNFTPWGKSGDKATPSLLGDVTSGVFLRRRRIFLGGLSGMVGPRAVGYGSMTGAGQVVRRDVADGRLSVQVARAVDEPLDRPQEGRVQPVLEKNVDYIAQLHALRAWYSGVRLPRARGAVAAASKAGGGDGAAATAAATEAVCEAALANIDVCIDERVTRLRSFLSERGAALPEAPRPLIPPCPLALAGQDGDGDGDGADHLAWVKALTDENVQRGQAWLEAVARSVRERLLSPG